MKSSMEKWYNHVCIQYALGKITDRVMRKYQTRYEATLKKNKVPKN